MIPSSYDAAAVLLTLYLRCALRTHPARRRRDRATAAVKRPAAVAAVASVGPTPVATVLAASECREGRRESVPSPDVRGSRSSAPAVSECQAAAGHRTSPPWTRTLVFRYDAASDPKTGSHRG